MDKFYFDTVKEEYYESLKEYRQKMLETGSSMDGCFQLEDYEDMEKWHLNLKLFESPETLPPMYSLGFEFVYICNSEVVGLLNFRPEAMSHPMLKVYGGHIGYSVKPTKRKMGIGTRMLKDFLPIAKNYGLKEVLVTCHEDNDGSRNIILNNGGVFESSIYFNPDGQNIERYFIKL